MKIGVVALVALLCGLAEAREWSQAGYWPVVGSPRRVVPMNPGWEFSLDGFKTAKRVSLPHCIDEGEIGFAASGGVNRQQPAWYRKTFAWTGNSARQFLHFEAIMGKSRVTLNGREVAAHFGGFLPIHVEVTGVLRRVVQTVGVFEDSIVHSERRGALVHLRNERFLAPRDLFGKRDRRVVRAGNNDALDHLRDRHLLARFQKDL